MYLELLASIAFWFLVVCFVGYVALVLLCGLASLVVSIVEPIAHWIIQLRHSPDRPA